MKVIRGAVASILVDGLFSFETEETKQYLTVAQILMQKFSGPSENEEILASWMTDNLLSSPNIKQARRQLAVNIKNCGRRFTNLFLQRNIR